MTRTDPAVFHQTAVIGAGAWGTTLAWLIGSQGRSVNLWARRGSLAQAMCQQRENADRLPGVILPDSVQPTADLAQALAGSDLVICAVPSEHLREVMAQARAHLNPGAIIVSATKGLELSSGKRMSQVIAEATGFGSDRILALSGPNLSAEIIAGMPATSVVAGTVEETVLDCQAFLSTPLFRIYANYDILGVEICGALKNVLAIAAGVSDGMGFGANAKAALLTRGLAEIGRLGTKLGASRATFWGVAGVGDILATCNSCLSRNYQVGFRLGRGERVAQILDTQGAVAEGVPTTAAVRGLAAHLSVELPIATVLHQILFEDREPSDAVAELMRRQWRAEAEAWQ
ncbi:MAG: NAD(P)-dependent glycerol-3-phosphate dehydrogenase [Armatimonadetes bacterium]|nr:NAD(P)-dependent glycerol-3-phosphate dehydrogenase [Armatimonadota bacterium]